MEINIITKNLSGEIARVNLSNKQGDYSTLVISEYNSEDTLGNKFELPVKSVANFLKELEKEKVADLDKK